MRASSRVPRKRLALLMLVVPLAAHAGPTPPQACESGKNAAAGRYAFCLHKAQAKYVKGGEADVEGRDDALVKCGDAFSSKWQSLESKAAGACPSTGDEAAFQAFLDACVLTAQDALGGGVLPPDFTTCTTDLAACNSDLATCDTDLTGCNGDLTTCNTDLTGCNGDLTTCAASLSTCGGSLTACNSDLSATNADLSLCATALGIADSGTAAAGDVLAGRTFTSSAGRGVTGTMPNNGSVVLTPSTSDQAIAAGYHNGGGRCAGDADLTAGNIKAGVQLFGVTGSLTGGGTLRTGQTICYDGAGTVVACGGSGQDGELQKGLARSFTDNGNGTVTDNTTGLMWEKLADVSGVHQKDAVYTWTTAFTTKINTLNSGGGFAGYTDWRLPNRMELESIVSLGAVAPATFTVFNNSCTPGCSTSTCSCTVPDHYWTSSTYMKWPQLAWLVNFDDGDSGAVTKTVGYRVRAVRGP